MRCFRYGADGVLVECPDDGERFREDTSGPIPSTTYYHRWWRTIGDETVGLYLRSGELMRDAYVKDLEGAVRS